jgi:hypothetical protein
VFFIDLIAHFHNGDQIKGIEKKDPGEQKKKRNGKFIFKIPGNGVDVKTFYLLDHDAAKIKANCPIPTSQ